MKARTLCLTAACLVLTGFLSDAGIAQQYSITDLSTLGGIKSHVYGINDLGQIVGTLRTSSGEYNAFMWQNGVIQNLGTLGGTGSSANSINNSGQVVGWSDTVGGHIHAFLWQNGMMHDLGTLGGLTSQVGNINGSGQVVGWSDTVSGHIHAFLWQNDTMQDLGTLGGAMSGAVDINDSAQVVGLSRTSTGENHVFLWDGGAMQDLGLLDPYEYVNVYAINDSGWIVGGASTRQVPINGREGRAFLWQNGVMQSLGTLGGYDLQMWYEEYGDVFIRVEISSAYAINDQGQIVGTSTVPSEEPVSGYLTDHAFLWENGVMTDLNSLISANSGWELVSATGINNNGWIIGTGTLNGQENRAFLLTPVPEPSGLLALVCGVGGLIAVRRRRR